MGNPIMLRLHLSKISDALEPDRADRIDRNLADYWQTR